MTEEQLQWITDEVMASLKLPEERRGEVERLAGRIGNMLLIRCNREDIPKMLEPVIAQMAEDMLREGASVGTGGTAGGGAVASITRGDTSISFQDDSSIAQAAGRLFKDYEPQIRRFKKMNLPKEGESL